MMSGYVTPQGSLSALSLMAAANPGVTLAAVAVVGGIAVTVAAAVFIRHEMKNYVEKRHLDEIKAINKLHEEYLAKIIIPGKNDITAFPVIFEMKSDKDISSIHSMHFNDSQVRSKGSKKPRGMDIALGPYHEAIKNAIMELQRYYFSRKERDDITSHVISYLIDMIDSHCNKFEGYDCDIATLQALASFINAYASKDKNEHTKTFSHLDPVYSHIVTAQHYLDVHKDKLSLLEIITDLNDSCRDLGDQFIRNFSMIINPSEYWDTISCVSKDELSHGMLKRYYVANNLLHGFITIPEKEIEVLPSPFKNTLIDLAKYAIKSLDPDTTLNLANNSDFHIMAKLPENFKDYINSYVFSDNKLLFVKPDLKRKNVLIKDLDLFYKTLTKINPNNAKLINLSPEQTNKLITSNGGHVLYDIPTINIVIPDLNRYLALKKKEKEDKIKLTADEKAEKKKIKNQLEELKSLFYKCKNFITTELDPKTRNSQHKFIAITDYSVLVSRARTIVQFANLIREITSLQYYSMSMIKGIKLLGEIDVTSPHHAKVFKVMNELCELVQNNYLKLKKGFYAIQKESDNAMQIQSATAHRDSIYALLETTNTTIGNSKNSINKYWHKNKRITARRKIAAEHSLFDAADVIGKIHSLPSYVRVEKTKKRSVRKSSSIRDKTLYPPLPNVAVKTIDIPDVSGEVTKKAIVPFHKPPEHLPLPLPVIAQSNDKIKLVHTAPNVISEAKDTAITVSNLSTTKHDLIVDNEEKSSDSIKFSQHSTSEDIKIVDQESSVEWIKDKLMTIQAAIKNIKKEEKPSIDDIEGSKYFAEEVNAYTELYSSMVGIYQKIKAMISEPNKSPERHAKITHMIDILTKVCGCVVSYIQLNRKQRIVNVAQFNQDIQSFSQLHASSIDSHDNEFWKQSNSILGEGFFKTNSRGKLSDINLACNNLMKVLSEEMQLDVGLLQRKII